MPTPLALPTAPDAARVFFGFRAERYCEQPGDSDAARAEKRTQFFDELGKTFMPGTPLMQAPLGLTAYLPAVVDPPAGEGLPDEVALVIYVSQQVYQSTRNSSLSRRMYTRSHYAAFDMKAAVAEFPKSIGTSHTVQRSVGPVDFWYLFEQPSDWQDGSARVLLLLASGETAKFRVDLRTRAAQASEALRAGGCDQVIVGCADRFALVWVHSTVDAGGLDLSALTGDAEIYHDLPYQGALVRGDAEAGVTITGASAFNWRFSRDLRYFK